jgi:hypothetical protein
MVILEDLVLLQLGAEAGLLFPELLDEADEVHGGSGGPVTRTGCIARATTGSSTRMACRGHVVARSLVTPPHFTASSSASTSLHSSKQQVDATLKVHVTRVCFKYFRCFRGMLQVLYINVAKVDWNVAHVVMTIHICFKFMFQMFHLFYMYVASIFI